LYQTFCVVAARNVIFGEHNLLQQHSFRLRPKVLHKSGDFREILNFIQPSTVSTTPFV
jgi:hypothetical protein